MSDELDEVRRYVNEIAPPDARTLDEVRGRLSAVTAAAGTSSVRTRRTTRFGRFAGRAPSSLCWP